MELQELDMGKAQPITLCELIIGTIAVETKVSLITVTTQTVLKGNIRRGNHVLKILSILTAYLYVVLRRLMP